MPCPVSREKAEHRCSLLTNSMFASSSRVDVRPSSIIRSMGGVRLKDPRNRPSGDPNCELFPQGPIIPVPPSSSPYCPVRICGNNWAVSPGRLQKESLRTRGFGGRYSRYFAGDFALRRCRNSIRRYSAAPKREFRSQFPLFPLFHARLLRRNSNWV